MPTPSPKTPPPPPPGPEKRRHPRIELFAQVQVTSGDEVHIMAARNASLGGLFVEGDPAEHPDLARGALVRVALFSTEDGTEQVQGDATVVRVDRGGAGRPAGLGLMWRALDPAIAERLARFLDGVAGRAR